MVGTTRFPAFGSTLLEHKVFGKQLDGPSVLGKSRREGNCILRHISSNKGRGNSHFCEEVSDCNKRHKLKFSRLSISGLRVTALPVWLAHEQCGTETTLGRAGEQMPAPRTSLNKGLDCLLRLSKLQVRNVLQRESLSLELS